jgi:colicin import membrane protein
MKKTTYAHAHPLGAGTDSRVMVLYFGISFLIHLIFIGSVIFMPESAPRRRFSPGAINVNLVSLPSPPSSSPAPAPAADTDTMPKKEVKPEPKAVAVETPPPKPLPVIEKPSKIVSLAPKKKETVPKKQKTIIPPPEPKQWKVKKSRKKQTQDRQKMIDQAVAKVQKNVEDSRSDSVKQALERLKKKVAQTEAGAVGSGQAAKAGSGAVGSGVPGASGSGGQRALELIDLYKIEIAFQVERQWAFSPQLAGNGGALQVSLVFKVLPSGEITDIRITQRSGNAYLDESAYKAVVKANPVSPHPAGIRAPYVMVAVRFTPEGIKK